jgi:hypothetical protein
VSLLAGLALVAGVCAAALAAGRLAVPAVCPAGSELRAERFAWSWAIGAALISAMVPLSLLVGLKPGWIPFLVLAAGALAAGRLLRVSGTQAVRPGSEERAARGISRVLAAVVLLGVALYALRALTEPMWSNDFLAIWGLKGKTIHSAGEVPRRLFEDPALGFSHPEYPIGLPLLYAGISYLTGRWDDHAMALLFPLFQVATLTALFGWLRRSGASRNTAWLAAAILACFEPLYSAFLTGMAEVPLALGLLFFGTALADSLDGEPGALRRLAAASALITATKNEGLFFAAAGCAIALLFGGSRRWKAAFASLPTALVMHGLHLAWRGRLPLRDFDFSTLSASRAVAALGAAIRLPDAVGWGVIALAVLLVALGRRVGEGEWMLGLCACALGAYVLLPVVAVRGPEWLVANSLARTTAALAPLAAAAVAIRLRPRGPVA